MSISLGRASILTFNVGSRVTGQAAANRCLKTTADLDGCCGCPPTGAGIDELGYAMAARIPTEIGEERSRVRINVQPGNLTCRETLFQVMSDFVDTPRIRPTASVEERFQ